MMSEDQMAFIVRRYQEIQKQNDNILKEYSDIKISLLRFESLLTELAKTQEADSKKYATIESENGKIKPILDSVIDAHNEEFKSLKASQENLQNAINSNGHSLQILNENIKQLFVNVGGSIKKSDLDSLKKKFLEIRNDYIAKTKDFVNLSQKVHDAHVENKAKFSNLENFKSLIDNQSKLIAKNTESIEWLSNQRKQDIEALYKKVDVFIGLLDPKINEAIAAIPKPTIPSIDDAKASILKSVEPMQFDAKNANLRSANNETKILLMEKKIEQLQLLVNKLKLEAKT